MQDSPQIAYLYSRYPVVSQTFCDTEMMALEAMGYRITIGSLNPPTTSFRHERLKNLQAEILYPAPSAVMDIATSGVVDSDPLWQKMAALAARHEEAYGKNFKPLTRARNAWHFAREFKKRGIKHVHIHFANRATHTALFLKLAGLTFSFTAHAQDFMIDLGSPELLQEMAQEAEFVIAVSDFSAELLREMCPESAGKIQRIYNGLDPAAFDVKPAAGKGFRILSVGRLIEFKGFQHLIPAISLLRDQGINAQLDIVGEGPIRSQLESQIASLALGDRVRLLGVQSQDQIKTLLENADVFALACIVDSKGASDILPTVITEALASGKPVVSTRLVGVPEMVDHGVSGLLAEPGNETELAGHLATLASDSNLRLQMGQAARRKFETTFTLQHTAGQLAEKFHRLAGHAPSAEHADVLCLIDSWPDTSEPARRELNFLTTEPRVKLLAGNVAGKLEQDSANINFLPNAMVLESAWRNSPALVAKAESLAEKCGSVDGEVFFREARRAVYLAGQLAIWKIRHIHAFRSSSMLCAWLVGKLTNVSISATVEHKPALGRSVVETLAKDFKFGSLSDEKLKANWPDELLLGEPPVKVGLFKKAPPLPMADVAKVWGGWLAKI